jgi:aminoglycoside phosphotransferase (APT) family kinase protein
VQPGTFGGLLGRALADVHVPLGRHSPGSALLSQRMPWILQMHSTGDGATTAAPEPRLVQLVRKDRQLAAALTRLARDWRNEALVHGDAKLDNVLVRTGARPRVWLVDWAFAGIGDPAWDVGTVLHSALLLWLHGIPFQRGRPLSDSIDRATLPLDTTRAFIRAFTDAYRDARRLRGAAARAFFRRAFRHGGAALLQSAIAAARHSDRPTTRQLAVIQMASHVLADPDDSLRQFLEIE